MKVAIIKSSSGNVRSVANAVRRLGVDASLTDDPAELASADRVIFPGVGEASSAMAHLRDRRLDFAIRSLTQPVLAICLGMQLLCEYSEEGDTDGLGIFPYKVRKFSGTELKVPHMGWNTIENIKKTSLLKNITDGERMYFVHSYFVPRVEETTAECDYGETFSAAIDRDNFYGVQFHPEKSGRVGAEDPAELSELMIEVIPAIDILEGKCVRLSKGDFSQVRVYSDDPVEMARSFADAGIVRLHLVDLDAARSGSLGNLRVLNAIADATSLVIDFSGGIRSAEEVRRVFDAGASIACMGSIAISDSENFFEMLAIYGPERIILAADVRGENVAVNGWQADTETRVIPFLSEYVKRGGRQAMITDIPRDGILAGPSCDMYSKILSEIPGVDLIASGGVSSLDDIERLDRIGCSGVIVGKAIYEGKISIDEIGRR